MLLALVSVPLLGSLIILMINSQRHLNLIKQVALITTVLTFIVSMVIWGQFDNSITGYQFVSEYNNTNFGHLIIGLDGLSLYFVLLTTFIIPFCILANWDNIQNNIKIYFISFLAIESFLIIAFIVLDLILFYIFFEAVLIPMFLVVGIWGGANRQRAAMLLFLYTLGGSLFILLSIMSIYYITGSTDFNVLLVSNFSTNVQYLLWLGFFISFAIKTPIIPIHQWLPRAHAEAPLAGSILLASVLLKLAAYGCLRILINYIPDATLYFTPLVQSIAIISLIYSSLATLRQVDFKVLVAYSSIGHIAIVILGLFSNTIIGIEGAIALSIAHGLISPAIFALVGGCLYDRMHTRIIRYYRGITLYMPVFSLLFFIASAFNIAVPLSLNYIGEFLSLAGVFQQSPIIGLLGASSIFLSACYTIYLFNRIAYGSYSKFITFTLDINRREFIVIIPLLLITLVLGVYPSIIFNDIHLSVSHIIYSPPA